MFVLCSLTWFLPVELQWSSTENNVFEAVWAIYTALYRSRSFYGVLYRCYASLAKSINNKCHYGLLWLYGVYAVLHSLPETAQVLLMVHRIMQNPVIYEVYIFSFGHVTGESVLSVFSVQVSFLFGHVEEMADSWQVNERIQFIYWPTLRVVCAGLESCCFAGFSWGSQ